MLLLWPRWDTGYKVWVWQVVYHQEYCVCFYMFKDIQFKIYKRCSTCGYVKHRYVSYHYILYYRILITKTIVLYGRRFMAEILFDLTLNNPFIDRWFFIMSLIIIIKCFPQETTFLRIQEKKVYCIPRECYPWHVAPFDVPYDGHCMKYYGYFKCFEYIVRK